MKYKYYVKTIEDTLKAYKAIIDTQEQIYLEDCRNLKNEAESMRGQWTENYISGYVLKNNPLNKHKQDMSVARAKCQDKVKYSLAALKYQLDSFFNAPISVDFANKINTIKSLGLQLSDREFDVLKQDAKVYLERRALNELAKNRTAKSMQVNIEENGKAKQELTDLAHPYNGVEVPNMDLIYNAFEEYANSANRVISSYSGTNAGLYEALDTNIPKHLSLTADSFFRNNATDKFASVMEAAEISKPIQKRVLTEADKAVIDTIIDPKFPYLAKSRVKQIAQNNFHLAELFSLDERYSKYVDEMEMKE